MPKTKELRGTYLKAKAALTKAMSDDEFVAKYATKTKPAKRHVVKKRTRAERQKALLDAATARARSRVAAGLKKLTDDDIRRLASEAIRANHPDREPFPATGAEMAAATHAQAVRQIEDDSLRPTGAKMELKPVTHDELLAQFRALPLKDLLKLNKALHQAIADAT